MHVINSIFCHDGSLPVTFSKDEQISLLSEIDCLLSLLDSTGNLDIINQVKDIRKFHHILYQKYLRDCEVDEYIKELEEYEYVQGSSQCRNEY